MFLKFKPVEEETITTTIMKLANKNSCGFGGISTNLLKIIEPAITKPLTIIINKSSFMHRNVPR